MLQKFLHLFVRRRHYWRNIGFDELSELYASMMFRSLAVSLASIFIPLYLYQHGREVWEILFFYALVFAAQTILVPLAAFLIAWYGPKHTILYSYCAQVVSLIALTQLDRFNIPLELIAVTMGMQLAFFFTAFNVDFSKVKHSEHGGKEASWAYSMQKAGSVFGPIIGGVVAYMFGSEYIFYAALVLFVFGAVPLLLTKEPTKLRQKLDFKHITFSSIKSDVVSFGAFNLENSISVVVWPLFIGVIVFKENPYIQIGSIASLSIIMALVIARMIGVIIDKKSGLHLLRYAAVLNAIVHLFRPFTNGYSSVLALNVVNEGVTVGYKLPYLKGLFDAADEHPGFRIVYISTLEGVGSFIIMIFYLLAGIAASIYGPTQGLFIGLFAVGAIASLGITLERYKALR